MTSEQLSYRLFGQTFRQPYLDPELRCLVVSASLYRWTADGDFQATPTSSYFEVYDLTDSRAGRRSWVQWPYGQVWELGLTEDILVKLLTLPLLDEYTYDKGLELLARQVTLRSTAVQAVYQKAFAQYRWPEDHAAESVVDEAARRVHKVPAVNVEREVEEVVKTEAPRQLDPMTLMIATFLPEEQRRDLLVQVLETRVMRLASVIEPVADAVMFEAYSTRLPFSQQLNGAWAIVRAKRIPLFYEMRTGKTITVQLAARHLVAQQEVDCFIVVCPVGNLYDPWEPELTRDDSPFRKHTYVLDGTQEEDAASIRLALAARGRGNPIAFVFNYERVESRQELLEDLLDEEEVDQDMFWSRTFVTFDESSAIKNPDSKRSKAARALATRCEYVVPLNGTPIEQGPQDLWAQMRLCDDWGVAWGHRFVDYCNRYLLVTGPGKWGPADYLEFQTFLSTQTVRYISGEADQSNGKDKQFRYIKLRPTTEIFEHTRQILYGTLKVIDNGEMRAEEMNQCLLRTYGFLREAACAYTKYRVAEGMPYTRVRDQFDPKIEWVLAYLTAYSRQQLVVFVEFNEQEQRLKEALNDLGIPWSSTRPEMELVTDHCLRKEVSANVARAIVTAFPQLDLVQWWGAAIRSDYNGSVRVPTEIRYHDEVVAWVLSHTSTNAEETPYARGLREKIEGARRMAESRTHEERESGDVDEEEENQRAVAAAAMERLLVKYREYLARMAAEGGAEVYDLRQWTETYRRFMDSGPYGSFERSQQVAAFNRGETRVFILKWPQGRGISLHCQEGVQAGVCEYPAIVSMAPPWSLGNWEQGVARCVTVDPRTGKNVCTMIYSLAINGTIETKSIIPALKNKKEVQSGLLQDRTRDGFSSFADEMVAEMQEGGSDTFDIEEMRARRTLGIPPFSNLTISRIQSAVRERYKLSKAATQAYCDERLTAEERAAYDYLIKLCS